jgi:hypothetical protein
MLAIVYLLICFFFGVQLLRFLFPDQQRLFVGIAPKKSSLTLTPLFMFYYPAGFIIGLVLVTFVTYWVALIMTSFVPQEMSPLYPADVVSLCLAVYLGSVMWQKCRARNNPPIPENQPADTDRHRRLGGHSNNSAAEAAPAPANKPSTPGFLVTGGSVVFYAVSVFLFIAAGIFVFYYSFHVTGGNICAGYSVFSDLAPHTALISSFSNGRNFPTVYPYFPNDGIRYHFLFYFLCGNLNLLGMRIDHALNIPSLLVMVCCFMLLGVLAVLLSGKRITFLLAPVLVLFRSSFAFVTQIKALAAASGASFLSVVHGIISNKEWIGSTPRDSWGLWAINVYANQRHLLLGVAMIIILIFLFTPHVRRMFLHLRKEEGAKAKIMQLFLSREAWLPRKSDPLHPYALGFLAVLIVLCMPYFHGSALVAALIILCAMALFSENRLAYVVVAAAAVISSLLQTQIFSGGASNVVSFAYYWGFIVDNPTFLNVVIYVAKMMGITSVLILILLFTQKNAYRTVLLIAFGLPAVFAFFFTMTVDVTANHKFVQVSLILFSIYLAALLTALWRPFADRKKSSAPNPGSDSVPHNTPTRIRPMRRKLLIIGSRGLAIILFISLTISGVSEWIVFYNLDKDSVQMNLSSPMVAWIEKNTNAKDVFLTAPYSMNTFFLSGRSSYYGHPYYAWSSGYDTEARMAVYAQLLTGCNGDVSAFLALCKQENISYILIDNDLLNQTDFKVDQNFFSSNLTQAASFPAENNTIIYKVS